MLVIRKDNIARDGNVDYVGIGSDGDADVRLVMSFSLHVGGMKITLQEMVMFLLMLILMFT